MRVSYILPLLMVIAANASYHFIGHAPRKCAVCGKWFLTTDARHTKYCSGYAPNDKRGRTCRQVGNLRRREQRELAAEMEQTALLAEAKANRKQ